MRRLLDERLDEMAAGAHRNAPARLGATLGAGLVLDVLTTPSTASVWVGLVFALEGWSWFATRPQARGHAVSTAQRLNHLANIFAESAAWFASGLLMWRTGTASGEVSGALVWISILAFAQTFAYQTPAGLFASGVAPGGAMLVFTWPGRAGEPGAWTRWVMLAVAVAFVLGLARQAAAARARLSGVERRLRESESLYRMLADNVTDVIALSTLDGRRRYISPSIEEALGYRVEDLMRTPNLTYLHPDDKSFVASVIGQLSPERPKATIEYRVMRADGGVTWAETSFTLAPGVAPDGSREFVTVSRVADARKALESELVDARRRAEDAAAAKSAFLANITHELRTPLNAILGFSGLLAGQRGVPPEARRQIEIITDASRTLLELVDAVLDFSRIEAGAVELDPAPFSPAQLVSDAAALVSHEAVTKGLAVTARASEADASAVLVGDAPRIRQVLLNLLSNAVKFTTAGGVSVDLDLEDAGANRIVRIAVSDTGIGLSESQIPHLFERFAQADASVSRRFGGSGLGLAISKGLIDLMGGRIGAESLPGGGARFWFEIELPVAGPALGAAPAEAAGEPPHRPIRLLLVEDVAVNRELVQALLDPFDIDIVCAADGAEAIDAVRRAEFDVILMDVQMPVMDGLTAARRMRADALTRAPIIAMTANVLPEQIRACLDAGMTAHIGKPISPAALLEAIATHSDPDAQAPASDADAAA